MAETKYYGKYRAKVVDVDDPERRGRIRVQCPAVLGVYKSAWCEPCIPYATDFAGDYYVPPIDEAIWVEFEEGDVDKPIWNGGWYKIDSSPLLPDSHPSDYRFISFKNTIIRMGDKEVIFEFRNDGESFTLKVDSSSVLGLGFIGSRSEQELTDLGSLIANTDFLLKQIPEALKETQDSLKSLGESFSEFVEKSYNPTIKTIGDTIESINTYLKSLDEVTFPAIDSDMTNLSSNFTLIQDKINNEIVPNITELDKRVTDLEQKKG